MNRLLKKMTLHVEAKAAGATPDRPDKAD